MPADTTGIHPCIHHRHMPLQTVQAYVPADATVQAYIPADITDLCMSLQTLIIQAYVPADTTDLCMSLQTVNFVGTHDFSCWTELLKSLYHWHWYHLAWCQVGMIWVPSYGLFILDKGAFFLLAPRTLRSWFFSSCHPQSNSCRARASKPKTVEFQQWNGFICFVCLSCWFFYTVLGIWVSVYFPNSDLDTSVPVLVTGQCTSDSCVSCCVIAEFDPERLWWIFLLDVASSMIPAFVFLCELLHHVMLSILPSWKCFWVFWGEGARGCWETLHENSYPTSKPCSALPQIC